MAELFFELWELYASQIIIGIIIIWLILSISLWGIFRKTNKKTWQAIIPIYQLFPFMEIIETPIFFVALLFFPIINIFALIFISYRLGKVFEQKGIMKYGLIIFPLLFYPILGLFKFSYKPSEQIENETVDINILYNNTPINEVTKEKTTQVLGNIKNAPKEMKQEEQVDIIDIDNEDETWHETEKQKEEEKKVVNITFQEYDPLFNPKAKPIEKGDLEHYIICPQCGAKLKTTADTCFLCGTKIG